MGTTSGQKFFCECGATIEYVKPCTCETVTAFRCTCGATGTELSE